jgi:hypothetical protein
MDAVMMYKGHKKKEGERGGKNESGIGEKRKGKQKEKKKKPLCLWKVNGLLVCIIATQEPLSVLVDTPTDGS